jgi:hypothetical protein
MTATLEGDDMSQTGAQPLSTPAVALRTANRFAPVAAGLMATLGLVPGLVGVGTVGIYLVLLAWKWVDPGLLAISVGAVTGVGLWLLLGVVFSWTADPARVSAGIFRDLQSRYLLIVGRVEAIEGVLSPMPPDRQRFYLQATAMRDELAPMFDPSNRSTARVGSQWITASGYIAAWHNVHLAEEALMSLEPDDEVVAAALYDRGRLQDSRISGRDDLLKQSSAAIVAIDATLAGILGWKGAAAPNRGHAAHIVLLNIKKTVNEYRDGLWETLIYLRRRTIQALVFTGMVGYLVVSLALLEGASSTAVVAGSGFYLAGAIIGLFQAAYQEQRRRTAVEDYGLSTARLLLLPLIAGIAGVIGAGMTAFLGAPPIGLDLLKSPDLAKAFDLGQYPLGLIAAAIFGLTPGLLLERVRALGDDVKFEIAKSEPSGNEKADVATDGN